MLVFNQSVDLPTYRTFDDFVRKSKLREKAGTLVLATDPATLELLASYQTFDAPDPKRLASARTVEALFAQVLLILTAIT